MDKEKAKEFWFDATHNCNGNQGKIYISKDLQKLMDMNDGELFFIYAVIETESGDTLMHMDWSYSGEPIIMRRFIHAEYFRKHHWNKEFVKL